MNRDKKNSSWQKFKNIKKISALLLVFIPFSIAAQNKSTLSGKVSLESGEVLDFYTVTLLSLEDSALIAGNLFFSEEFKLEDILPKKYILQIINTQFQPFETAIDIHSGSNNITEPIILKEHIISEVVVTAKRPAIYEKNGNLVLDVSNSYLKDEINLSSLLDKVPGIEVSASGGISLFGKENLILYINDREAFSQEQLSSLKPTDILRLEIIKNPGAEYTASADAVIKIWTKSKKEENFKITISNDISYNNSWSDGYYGSITYNSGKTSQHFSYGGGVSNSRQFDNNQTNTYLTEYISSNHRKINMDNNLKSHNTFYSIDYEINNKNKIGLQYSGNINKWKSKQYGIQTIKNDKIEKKRINLDNKDINNKNLHNLSVNYSSEIKKNGYFNLISDYAFSDVKIENHICETSLSSNKPDIQLNKSSSDYNIFSIQPDFNFNFNKNRLSFGGKYSTMNSKSQIDYYPSNDKTKHNLNEHIGALHITWNGKNNILNYGIGLRGEYNHTNINVNNSEGVVSCDYWNLFPFLMVGKDITESINVSAYYRKRIQRPSFSALNPTYLYRDSLSYSTGNPYLKPMDVDIFALFVDVSNFSASIGYNIYKNAIFMEDKQDADNPSVAVSTYGNMSRKRKLLTTSISYNLNCKRLSGVISFNYNKPYTEIAYRESFKEMDKAIYLFKLSANWKLHDNTSLNASYLYRSKGESDNMEWKSYSRLNLSINQYALKKNLLISLSFDDIINKNRTNRWTSYSNNIQYMMDSDPDTRYINLSLRYSWGLFKKRIDKKSSNSESINRM